MPTGTVTVVVMARCSPGIGSSVRPPGGKASPIDPEVAWVPPAASPIDPEVTKVPLLDPLAVGWGGAIALAGPALPCAGAAGAPPPGAAAPAEEEDSDKVAGEPLLPAVLGAAKGSAAIVITGV